jgi:hypothetical protein
MVFAGALEVITIGSGRVRSRRLACSPRTRDSRADGKRGQRMCHFIVPGGAYARAYAQLAATGFRLHWESSPPPAKKGGSRLKYSCPHCQLNAWAKPDARIVKSFTK